MFANFPKALLSFLKAINRWISTQGWVLPTPSAPELNSRIQEGPGKAIEKEFFTALAIGLVAIANLFVIYTAHCLRKPLQGWKPLKSI